MPAAAPNLTTLFDFEGQFESAGQELLIAALIDAYKTGDTERLPLENTGVAFDLGPAVADKLAQLAKPASWPAGAPPPQEYFIYSGTIEFRVTVPADDNEPTAEGVTSKLSQTRGKLRELMMECVRPFNEVNLPYYKVARIRPDGSSWTAGEGGKIQAFLRYALNFEIRKTAWPAWVEE